MVFIMLYEIWVKMCILRKKKNKKEKKDGYVEANKGGDFVYGKSL